MATGPPPHTLVDSKTSARLRLAFNSRSRSPGTLGAVTTIKVPLVQEQRPVESAAEERLWDALSQARNGRAATSAADLEDTLCQLHLPLARAIAQATVAESAEDRAQAEETAQLALADAVRSWRQRTGGGFRYHAQSAILHRLQGYPEQRQSA